MIGLSRTLPRVPRLPPKVSAHYQFPSVYHGSGFLVGLLLPKSSSVGFVYIACDVSTKVLKSMSSVCSVS